MNSESQSESDDESYNVFMSVNLFTSYFTCVDEAHSQLLTKLCDNGTELSHLVLCRILCFSFCLHYIFQKLTEYLISNKD